MALQWQNTQLPFGRGIDTKTDPKLVVPPFLTHLENGIFNNGGSIIKRQGFKPLPRTADNGTIANGLGLASYQDELLLFDGTFAYSYAPGQAIWRKRGSLTSLIPKTAPLASSQLQYRCQHSAVANSTRCAVYIDGANNVRVTVQDTQTGTVHIDDAILALGGFERPKVVSAVGGQYFFIFYHNGVSSISVARIAVANPTVILAPINLVSDLYAGIYDVASLNGTVTLCYSFDDTVGNSGFKIIQVTDTGFVGTKRNGHADPLTYSLGTTGNAPAVISVTAGTGHVSTVFFIAVYSRFVRLVRYESSGLSYPQSTLIENTIIVDGTPNNSVHAITAVQLDDPSDHGSVDVYYDTIDGNVRVASNDYTLIRATPYSGNIIAKRMSLATGAFAYMGSSYVSTYYDSAIQPTYFVYSSASALVGKHSAQIAAFSSGPVNRSTLPPVIQTAPGLFEFAKTERGNLTSDAQGNVSFPAHVVRGIFDFNRTTRYATAELNYNLYIVAGLVYLYDGASLVDDGFALSPEALAITSTATGGSQTDGVRVYKACWAWTDSRGQVHRSATSIPTTLNLQGGTATQLATLTFRPLIATLKTTARLEVYRTINNGTFHLRIATVAAPLDGASIVVNDGYADSTIGAFPSLYTDGNELDNDAPIAMRHVFAARNRLFGIPAEAPYTLWYTKEAVKGVGVGWSAGLVRQVPPLGGECEVVGAIDDTLIVFKATKFYGFQGQGPTNTGAQDDFSPFALINTDVGCSNGPSLVFTSEGLMFQSDKGLRLLSRTLQIMDVGAPVQAFNQTLVTSARLLPDVNQVRFTTATGTTLVYDYYWKAPDPSGQMSIGQWSTFTNQDATDSAVWKGGYVYLHPNGTVMQETPGYYLDDDVFYPLRVETANIAVAGAQGLFRCRRAYLLGTYASPHVLSVGIAYNYGDVTQRQIWRTDQAINITTFGSDPTFGEGKVYGGPNDGVYQFRINPSRQRVQAIRFTFEDAPLDRGPVGASYSLTGLALEVGGKKGLFKLGTSKTART